jgi:hypothetical protein
MMMALVCGDLCSFFHHIIVWTFFSFVTLSFLVNSSVPIQLIKSFLTFKDFRTSWFQLRVVRFSVKIALSRRVAY